MRADPTKAYDTPNEDDVRGEYDRMSGQFKTVYLIDSVPSSMAPITAGAQLPRSVPTNRYSAMPVPRTYEKDSGKKKKSKKKDDPRE